MRYRVMVEEETGEESCHGNDLEAEDATKLALKLKEDHVEWRGVWVEVEDAPPFWD